MKSAVFVVHSVASLRFARGCAGMEGMESALHLCRCWLEQQSR